MTRACSFSLREYSHTSNARKLDALETFTEKIDGQNLGRTENDSEESSGGRREARTPDLRVANAALSQLS
jgi:hypothetical protein